MVVYFDVGFTSPQPGQLRIPVGLVVELTQLGIILTTIEWCTSFSVDRYRLMHGAIACLVLKLRKQLRCRYVGCIWEHSVSERKDRRIRGSMFCILVCGFKERDDWVYQESREIPMR